MADTRRRLVLAIDKASVRETDENGFLHVAVSPLTMVQVAPYYGYEIPHYQEMKLEPRKTYFGYRPADELSKPETVKSVNGIPIQFGHHEEYPDAPKNKTRVGMTGTDGEFQKPYLLNSLHIIDRTAQDAIKSGEARELSLAYAYDPDFTAGETDDGQKYDFVMRNITANHVALVERGRAGSSVLVKDSSLKENPKMEGNEKLATLEEKLTEEVVPALQDAIKEIQAVADNSDADAKAKDVPATDATEAVEEVESKEVEVPEEDVGGDEPAPDADEQPDIPDEGDEGEDEDSDAEADEDEDAQSKPDSVITQALEESGYADKSEQAQQGFIAGIKFAIKEAEASAGGKEEPAEDADPDEDEFEETETYETEAETPPSKSAPVKEEVKEERTLATDEARKIRNSIIAEYKAIDECKPVLGNIRLGAFDSAGDVYLEALKQLGVSNIGKSEARSCYLCYVAGMQKAKQSQKQVMAQDSKPKAGLMTFLTNVTD